MKLHLVVSWHHFSVVVVVAVPLPRLLLDLPLLLRRRRAPVHQKSHSGTNSLLSSNFATSEITSIQFCHAGRHREHQGFPEPNVQLRRLGARLQGQQDDPREGGRLQNYRTAAAAVGTLLSPGFRSQQQVSCCIKI